MPRKPKVKGGLHTVLFLRVERCVLAGLDELTAARCNDGIHIPSRADIVRELLVNGLLRAGIDVRKSDTKKLTQG